MKIQRLLLPFTIIVLSMSSVLPLTAAAERHKSCSFCLLRSQFRIDADMIFRICETGLNVAFALLGCYAALSGTIS